MENVRVGLRQSKLGQNVEILYLNENRIERWDFPESSGAKYFNR